MKTWATCPPCMGDCQQGRRCPARWADTDPDPGWEACESSMGDESCLNVPFELGHSGTIAARAFWPVYLLAMAALLVWGWRAWPWL